MEEFDGSALRRNPVVPASRYMERWIEPEDAIGEGVAAAEIVEQPAVDFGFAKGLLNFIYALVEGRGHGGRHLIVEIPRRQ